MKHYLLKSMLLVAFVAFSNLTLAQIDVTLHVIDTSKTLTTVKAKGAFNDWALVDLTKTETAEANDFSVTIQVDADGDYEWGAIQDDGSEWGLWLPTLAGFGSNPSFNVTGSVVSGDTAIAFAVLGPVDVVVAVDMSFELSKGGFDIATDSVGIAGNVNGWSYTKLTKGATDSVYTGTVQWGNYMEYKFRKNGEWEGSPNRSVFLDGNTDPVELDTVWYSNISPAPLVTIKNYVIDSTEYYTGLQYKGEITGWSLVPMFDDGTNGDDVADDHVWTVTLDDVTAGNSYEWGAVDGDENWLIAGPNRVVEVTMEGLAIGDTSYVIPPWGAVSVTFLVDMNCHINLEVFDRDTSCLDVNMDGYPPVEMAYADTGVYTATITRFDIGDTLAYTYRIDCAFGGDYEEYPGAQSNRIYVVVDGENSTGVELYQDDILTESCEYVPGTGVKNVYMEMIRIYPNPVYHEMNIVSEFEIQSIEVHNITGQKVMTETGINEYAHFMSTEELIPGIYLISVNGANGERALSKIIKNK